MAQQPARAEGIGNGAFLSSSVSTGISSAGNSSVIGIGSGVVLTAGRNALTAQPAPAWAFQLLPGLYSHYQKVADIFRRYEFESVTSLLSFSKLRSTLTPLTRLAASCSNKFALSSLDDICSQANIPKPKFSKIRQSQNFPIERLNGRDHDRDHRARIDRSAKFFLTFPVTRYDPQAR